MKRVPIFATLIAAAAVAVMIALGVWQLQRAVWKERLLGDLSAAQSLPPIDLDPMLAAEASEASEAIAFRGARVTCRVQGAVPAARIGRSLAGATGYSFFVPCRAGAPGLGGRLQLNVGWSQSPQTLRSATLDGPVEGVVGSAELGRPVILTTTTPLSPLEASGSPRVEDIPNNHLGYAGQWFFFAAAAAAIYLLALRRRWRGASGRAVAGAAPKP